MTSIIDLRDDMIYEILPFFEIDVKVGIFENAIWLKESASSKRWSPHKVVKQELYHQDGRPNQASAKRVHTSKAPRYTQVYIECTRQE